MSKSLKILSTIGLLAFASGTFAQDTQPAAGTETPPAATADAPAADAEKPDLRQPASESNPLGLQQGQPVVDENAPGTVYVKEKIGDWEIRCTRVPEGEKEPCLIYQLLRDTENNAPVAEITMFALPEGQKAAVGATIITPLETLLTKQLTLAVDGGPTKRYPFTWCSANGCYARIGFSNADVASFKRGAKATITIVPVVAPTKQIKLPVSLAGFTKAYDTVKELNTHE